MKIDEDGYRRIHIDKDRSRQMKVDED